MWLILGVAFIFIILDLTKVLKCNTLGMSVAYILVIPTLIISYLTKFVTKLFALVENHTAREILKLVLVLVAAMPIFIMLIVILVKICKNPINKERFSGDDNEYNLACIKRQQILLRVGYVIQMIALIASLISGIYTLVIAAGFSTLMFNPAFWFFSICTFGIFFFIYVCFFVQMVSIALIIFTICSLLYSIYLIISLSMLITMLYRTRKISGYTKGETIKFVISMIVPIWGIYTLVRIGRKIKEIENVISAN